MMTNNLVAIAKKLAIIILIIFLIIISFAVLVIFLKFSEIEKRIDADDIDYTKLREPSHREDTLVDNSQDIDVSALITGDANNYSLGTEQPKITIVEFADFACPYCKKSFSTIREISLNYNKLIQP